MSRGLTLEQPVALKFLPEDMNPRDSRYLSRFRWIGWTLPGTRCVLTVRMQTGDDLLVVVQRDWDGWQKATVRLGDLENVHWSQPPGAPRPLIHAHVWCTSVRSGDLSHECPATPAPHQLLVCVLKRHIAPSVYAELAERAGDYSALSSWTAAAGAGQAPSAGWRRHVRGLVAALSVSALVVAAAFAGVRWWRAQKPFDVGEETRGWLTLRAPTGSSGAHR